MSRAHGNTRLKPARVKSSSFLPNGESVEFAGEDDAPIAALRSLVATLAERGGDAHGAGQEAIYS